MNFKDLGLCPELLRVIDELGYEEPTPVQAKAIPILEGRDMVGPLKPEQENRSLCLAHPPKIVKTRGMPGLGLGADSRIGHPDRRKLSHLRQAFGHENCPSLRCC